MQLETWGKCLRLVATGSAGLFAGAALYVNLVEHPARMTHVAASAVAMWKPSFLRAYVHQKRLMLVSSISSLAVVACCPSGSHSHEVSRYWMIPGLAMLSLWPVTIFFLAPINSQLLETEKCISERGDDWIVAKLCKWNKMHSIRTVISIGAFGMMMYLLTA